MDEGMSYIDQAKTLAEARSLQADYARVMRELGLTWKWGVEVRPAGRNCYQLWAVKTAVLPEDA